MAILAIDTSMAACSVALLKPEQGGLIQNFEPMARGHAEAVFPMIEAVMAQADLEFHQLTKIAVTLGPGSFTGVRAGLAAARGLALAAHRPLVGVTSLEVMACGFVRKLVVRFQHLHPVAARTFANVGIKEPRANTVSLVELLNLTFEHEASRNRDSNVKFAPLAGREGQSGFAIAHDARRDEIYFQTFGRDGKPLSEAQVLSHAGALAALPPHISLIAGSGAAALMSEGARQSRTLVAILPDLFPEAADLARLAEELEPQDRPPAPLYLRSPDAKPQNGKILARAE